MHIIFCRKNQENVLQIETKEWNFEACLLTEEPSSWLLLIESWKMTCTRSYGWFLIFLSNGVGLDCFPRPNVLSKFSKTTVTCPKEKKEQVGSILTCPKSAKWISTLDCSKPAKWPIWKSEYFQSQKSLNHQIWTAGKPHLKGSIGYFASEGSVSLYHKHVRGYCYQISAVKPIRLSIFIAFWSREIDKSLYFQLYRGHRGLVHYADA